MSGCVLRRGGASPCMCLFNFNCYCTYLFIPAVVNVGKYCVMSNFSEAAVLRVERCFVIRLWKCSFITSV